MRIVDIVINLLNLFSWIVFIDIILHYFMSPYHPVRQTLDRLVEPFLAPIRRVVPLVGMIDFSPLVLILLIRLVSMGIIGLFT